MDKTPEELGFFDWNKLDTEDCINYLKGEHLYSSTGESFCILKVIKAYEELLEKRRG